MAPILSIHWTLGHFYEMHTVVPLGMYSLVQSIYNASCRVGHQISNINYCYFIHGITNHKLMCKGRCVGVGDRCKETNSFCILMLLCHSSLICSSGLGSITSSPCTVLQYALSCMATAAIASGGGIFTAERVKSTIHLLHDRRNSLNSCLWY